MDAQIETIIRKQRDKIEELEEEILQLWHDLRKRRPAFPLEWNLPPALAAGLAALMNADDGFVHWDHLVRVMVKAKVEDVDDPRKIVMVQMVKLRRRLAKMDSRIEIKSRWNAGYWLPPESAAIIKAMMP